MNTHRIPKPQSPPETLWSTKSQTQTYASGSRINVNIDIHTNSDITIMHILFIFMIVSIFIFHLQLSFIPKALSQLFRHKCQESFAGAHVKSTPALAPCLSWTRSRPRRRYRCWIPCLSAYHLSCGVFGFRVQGFRV